MILTSWGDHVFVEKLISSVVDLDSIPDWLEIEEDLLTEVVAIVKTLKYDNKIKNLNYLPICSKIGLQMNMI